jgi:hypothetical protein
MEVLVRCKVDVFLEPVYKTGDCCTICRNDNVRVFQKEWRVDWKDGSTCGISNDAGEHKELSENALRKVMTHDDEVIGRISMP